VALAYFDEGGDGSGEAEGVAWAGVFVGFKFDAVEEGDEGGGGG